MKTSEMKSRAYMGGKSHKDKQKMAKLITIMAKKITF